MQSEANLTAGKWLSDKYRHNPQGVGFWQRATQARKLAWRGGRLGNHYLALFPGAVI